MSHYVGSELELFAAAANWKTYVATQLRPFIAGSVLEVGAGIGNNIAPYWNDTVTRWTALEPDPALTDQIRAAKLEAPSGRLQVITGTLAAIEPDERFESILYIDVLEHIRDDAAELVQAAAHLSAGGHLVVLVPAHQFLFAPFDEAIGHHRRYNFAMLARLTPPGCAITRGKMLDSVGFFASLANRLCLRSAMPTSRQIAFWDSVLVPLSRVLDRLTLHRFGKTAVMIWSRS